MGVGGGVGVAVGRLQEVSNPTKVMTKSINKLKPVVNQSGWWGEGAGGGGGGKGGGWLQEVSAAMTNLTEAESYQSHDQQDQCLKPVVCGTSNHLFFFLHP